MRDGKEGCLFEQASARCSQARGPLLIHTSGPFQDPSNRVRLWPTLRPEAAGAAFCLCKLLRYDSLGQTQLHQSKTGKQFG